MAEVENLKYKITFNKLYSYILKKVTKISYSYKILLQLKLFVLTLNAAKSKVMIFKIGRSQKRKEI